MYYNIFYNKKYFLHKYLIKKNFFFIFKKFDSDPNNNYYFFFFEYIRINTSNSSRPIKKKIKEIVLNYAEKYLKRSSRKSEILKFISLFLKQSNPIFIAFKQSDAADIECIRHNGNISIFNFYFESIKININEYKLQNGNGKEIVKRITVYI